MYWLVKLGWSQAQLVRAIRDREARTAPPAPRRRTPRRVKAMQLNTVSRACRGLDTNTAQLRRMAAALNVPLADVLVSPELVNREQDNRARTEQVVRIAMRLIAEERQQEVATAYQAVRADIAAKDIRDAAEVTSPTTASTLKKRREKRHAT